MKAPEGARHYERAFDQYLRARKIPYVRIEDARRLLVPFARTGEKSRAGREPEALTSLPPSVDMPEHRGLKFFDYVVYGQGRHLLVEVKGRRCYATVRDAGRQGQRGTSRLESWTTHEDIASLQTWQRLFAKPFEAVVVFVYWCEGEPPDALFQEVFECADRWYALRAVRVDDYARAMKVRSPRWRTVELPPAEFARLSAPFAPQEPHKLPPGNRIDGHLLPQTIRDPLPLPDLERLVPAGESVGRAR